MNELGPTENYPEDHPEFIGPKLREAENYQLLTTLALSGLTLAIESGVNPAPQEVIAPEVPSAAASLEYRLTSRGPAVFAGPMTQVESDYLMVRLFMRPQSSGDAFLAEDVARDASDRLRADDKWQPLGAALVRHMLIENTQSGSSEEPGSELEARALLDEDHQNPQPK